MPSKVQEFIDAARHGNVELLEKMLDEGEDINAVYNKKGDSALKTAARFGKVDAVKFLIERGADLELEGANPLHFVAYYGLGDLIPHYIEKGCDVNGVDVNGSSAFIIALESVERCRNQMIPNQQGASKCKDCAEIFLEKNVDVNIQNNSGLTALHWAAMTDSVDIVRTLMVKDAKIDVIDKDGDLPMDLTDNPNIETILQVGDRLQETLSSVVSNHSAEPAFKKAKHR